MSELDLIVNDINKKYGVGTIRPGNEFPKFTRISSGVFSLDVEIGGGLPKGRLVIFTGNESTGKTTVAKLAIAQFQNTCKNCLGYIEECGCNSPEPHKAVFVDIEGAFDSNWFSQLGGNLDELLLIQPEYAEQACDVVEALVGSGEVDIIVVDSIAMMTPAIEIEESADKALIGTHARLMNKMMRLIQSRMNSLGMTNERKPAVILINQIREKVGVMYGCLGGTTKIRLEDGRFFTMKELVDKKIQGSVLSYNESTKSFDYKRIIDHHYNGTVSDRDDFLHILSHGADTKNGTVGIVVTKDHLLYTSQGTKKARDLTHDDLLVSTSKFSFLEGTIARDFLMGCLIGDSHIDTVKHKCKLVLQDNVDVDYLAWKVHKLSSLMSFRKVPNSRGGRFDSESSHELALLKAETSGRDLLNFIRNEFSVLGLCIWYLDDGHFDCSDSHYRAVISAKRLRGQTDTLQEITEVLTSKGFICNYNEKDGSIRFTAQGTRCLFSHICSYVPSCMERKIGVEYRGRYEDFSLESDPVFVPIGVPIKSIKPISDRQTRNLGRYDITVEDNHNYMAGSKDNGVIVHNSPETYPGGRGQKFASSITVKFTTWPSELVYEGEKKKDVPPVAVPVRFKVEKNKTFLPYRSGMFTIYISDSSHGNKGTVNTAEQIIDYGVRYGLIEKSGAWLTVQTEDKDFKEQHQGKPALIKALSENPNIQNELMEKILEKILEESSVKIVPKEE